MNVLRFTSRFLASAALLASAACGDSSGPEVRIPARMVVVSGDQQTATAGTELPSPLVVRVLDEDGKVVKGQIVNFRVVSGGGSVFAGSALTNNDGIAQERWTLGTLAADSQKVEVRAVDSNSGQAQVFGVFRATATAAAPALLTPMGVAAKTGAAGAAVADSPAVRVNDTYGNPVAGVAVSWTATGGSTVPATVQTGADGVARAGWTLPPRVGAYTATASAGVLGSAVFTADAAAPANAVLEKTAGDGQTVSAGSAWAPVEVRLRLPDGRPIEGAIIHWQSTSLHLDPPSTVTDANGRSSRTFAARTTTGAHQLTVNAQGGTTGVAFSLSTVAGPVARLHYTLADLFGPYTVGTVAPEILSTTRAIDQYGNSVPNTTIHFTVTAGNGSVSPAQALTDAFGQAKTTWTLGTVAGLNELRFSAPGTAAQPVTVGLGTIKGPAATADVTPDTVRLAVGDSARISGRAWDAYGNEIFAYETRVSTWQFYSANSSIARADPNLNPDQNHTLVRGVAPGTTTVEGRFTHRNQTAIDTVVVIVQ